MPKRWGWMVCGFGAVGAGLGALWFGSKPLPTVRFWDGTISRVVKVSYGTNHVFIAEPLWKQALRKVLPQRLEKPLGSVKRYARSTQYDSLAIFLDPAPPHSMGAQILFQDGSPGRSVFHERIQVPVLVFTSYPRDQRELLLRFSDLRAQRADVRIPNPHPVSRAAWPAGRLSKTNRTQGTQIVFDAPRFWNEWRLRNDFLSARSSDGNPTGWTRWRTTVFDQLGNWYAGDYNAKPLVPGSKHETRFRLLAEGQEYISAGFVTVPTNEQHCALTLDRRATNWGVQFVALLGPGSYEVTENKVQTLKSISLSDSFVRRNRASWLLQCSQPSLLSIATRPVSELRLRERLPHNKGRVFTGRSTDRATHELMIAQLFTSRLPSITTNLEAEVVVQLPPVEFFIAKP